MKFFSLFSGKEVHLASKQKIIPAKEFSVLQSAKEILKETQKEADAFRKSLSLEAEKIKEDAFKEGFQKGLESLNEHLLALDREQKRVQEKFNEEVEQKIVPLALKAAQKIVGEELKIHPDRIVDIVINALKPVLQHKKITIYVNRIDLDTLEKAKSKIRKNFEKVESLSFQERADVSPGGCVIETEAGIINAELENQWRALESAFASFMKKG